MDGYYLSMLAMAATRAMPHIIEGAIYIVSVVIAILIAGRVVNERWRNKPKIVDELVRREYREKDKMIEKQKTEIGELKVGLRYLRAQLKAAANQNLHTQQILAGERVTPTKGKVKG